MSPSLTAALLAWYSRNARDLPWRRTRDPYAIWVSEIMLQQTRVETVIPYYERWMARFPSVRSLAQASLDEVLRMWEGLGYYRRVHQLHSAARRILRDHDGRLPESEAGWRRLPGVGSYTAAAVAAIAFNAHTLALDGNLRRVLARLFDLERDPLSPAGERLLREQAEPLLPPGGASLFNQALMDLGAVLCTPRAPRCEACPLAPECLANARGTQALRPVRPCRRAVPRRVAVAGVLRRRGLVLLGRRPPGKLLGGLWEFPGGKVEPGERPQAALRRELREELGIEVRVGAPLGRYRHAYAHFRVTVHAFLCHILEGEPQPLEHTTLRWVAEHRLPNYPMGKVDRAIARRLGGPQPGSGPPAE